MNRIRVRALVCTAAAITFAHADVKAQGVSFSVVADTSTPMPSPFDTSFAGFNSPGTALADGLVVFEGVGPGFLGGGFFALLNGAIVPVATTATPVPESTGNFMYYGGTSAWVMDGHVLVLGGNGTTSGVYAWTDGSLSRVVDRSTVLPEPIGTPWSFGLKVTGSPGSVVFWAGRESAPGQSWITGLFRKSGSAIVPVATVGDVIPGYGGLDALDPLTFACDGDAVAFLGIRNPSQTPTRTLFYSDGLTTCEVVRDGVGYVACPGPGRVLFQAWLTIYLYHDGGITLVVDPTWKCPSSAGSFDWIDAFASDDHTIVLWARDPLRRQGLYLFRGGATAKIIGVGDAFMNSVVAQVAISDDAVSGNQVAFHAELVDGTRGVYLADISNVELCPDINGDGVVDQDDLDILLFGFGQPAFAGTHGDLDGNGVIDQDDLDLVLFHFGSACP